MALQDLTPQLRTRLSRMERAVGWFVLLAVGLLVFGFVYYVYTTATRKGWFLVKAPYYTYVQSATGLRVGDPVKMMGFDAGTITRIDPMPADQFVYNVYVEFELKSPNYGYIWTEGSRARVNTADLLGKRVLEVNKGSGGYPSYIFHPLRRMSLAEARAAKDFPWWKLAQEVYDPEGTNLIMEALQPLSNAVPVLSGDGDVLVMDTREKRKFMTGVWNDQHARYDFYDKKTAPYWLLSDEGPAITERLQQVVEVIEKALPGVFTLTNQLAGVLSNSAALMGNLNEVALSARPAVSNLAAATALLDRPGALGEWLLPTNVNARLESVLAQAGTTLSTANTTLDSANTNLTALAKELSRSLDSLAGITSNLNSQVQANTNILEQISETIVHADQFVQGLKRHWLLRSAFKSKKQPAPPREDSPARPVQSPKEKSKR
jgi:ABC-type transporter Mla subunit MlaD